MKRIGERGFTLVEIMIVVAIIALLAAIAIPNVLRGRATANESASIGSMHALITSLEMYRSTNNSYADDWLGDMVTNAQPDFAPASFAGANSGNFNIQAANANLQGFTYLYTPAVNSTTPQTYTLTSRPTTTSTGSRSFFADESGVLRHCACPASGTCNAAIANSNTLDASPANCP